jgi:hypothetical protein
MIRLIRTHMKIIFNRCNDIFYLIHICFYIHIFSMLICLLLIAGGWTKMVGGGTRRGRERRRRNTTTLYSGRWSSR